MNIALIVFAGSGNRIHSDIPKQFIKINDIELVVYTIRRFVDNPNIDKIVLVTSEKYLEYTETLVDKFNLSKIEKVVVGGATRQESVRLGLEAIDFDDNDSVLIHDGDRPLVSNAIINNAIMYLQEFEAVCPILDKSEEIPEISNSGREIIYDNHDVDVQTPQGFKLGLIKNAHQNMKNKEFADDIGLIDGKIKVKFFEGEKENFKVTKDCDLEYINEVLSQK